jgi:SAF domain
MADGVAVSPVRRLRGRDEPAVTSRGSTSASGRGRALTSVRQRPFRLPEVVLGVLLVAGCALGAVLWQKSTNSTSTVVVASRPIARGAVIGPDDLRGAQIGGETSAMISGDSARSLLGKVALVDIGADVPMTLTLLTDARPLGADEALTSMALDPGQLPPDLAPNDDVRIVVTARPDPTAGIVATLLDERAVVWSVDDSASGVAMIVTVRGTLTLATSIAAADEIRLVRVEGG